MRDIANEFFFSSIFFSHPSIFFDPAHASAGKCMDVFFDIHARFFLTFPAKTLPEKINFSTIEQYQ